MDIIFGDNAFVPTVLGATCNVIVSICTTAEKTVKLAENEVDNLHAEQGLRLDAIAQQRSKPASKKAA